MSLCRFAARVTQPLLNCPRFVRCAGCSSAEGRTNGDRACLDSVHGAMGNPGRRRRPGRHRWLRALISRRTAGRSGLGEAAPARLLADPAEFGWPDNTAAQRPLDDPAESWPADPAAYQWLGGWTDEPAQRRLLDDPAEPDWAADIRPAAEPPAFAQFTGADADQPMPGLDGRRRAGWPSRITQRDWYQARSVPVVCRGQRGSRCGGPGQRRDPAAAAFVATSHDGRQPGAHPADGYPGPAGGQPDPGCERAYFHAPSVASRPAPALPAPGW